MIYTSYYNKAYLLLTIVLIFVAVFFHLQSVYLFGFFANFALAALVAFSFTATFEEMLAATSFAVLFISLETYPGKELVFLSIIPILSYFLRSFLSPPFIFFLAPMLFNLFLAPSLFTNRVEIVFLDTAFSALFSFLFFYTLEVLGYYFPRKSYI